MKLTTVTFEQLQEAGVNTSQLLASAASGWGKREGHEVKTNQSSKSFSFSESGGKALRTAITTPEDRALEIVAFDNAMRKASEKWGLLYWKVPDTMLDKAKVVWPYVKKEVPA